MPKYFFIYLENSKVSFNIRKTTTIQFFFFLLIDIRQKIFGYEYLKSTLCTFDFKDCNKSFQLVNKNKNIQLKVSNFVNKAVFF